MTQEEVFEKVRDALVEALALDEEQVTSEASIMRDLGAESIDILDIVFRLEKAFRIKIPPGDLFPDNILNNPEYVDQGKLTPAGLAKLEETLPHVDFSELRQNSDVTNLMSVFKVQTIVNYVQGKLTDGDEAGADVDGKVDQENAG